MEALLKELMNTRINDKEKIENILKRMEGLKNEK